MTTILYNPNNVAYEGSPATTALELEVGTQLATMVGYNPTTVWGHITTDGTVANYEGLWMARNLPSVALALKAVQPELVHGLDEWQLLTLPTATKLALLQQPKATGVLDAVRKHTVRGTGMQGEKLGKLLVPQSKHYSWMKAVDVFGIGEDNLVSIQVKDNYRMDITHLRATIDQMIREKTPILGVVAVVGTTEEGAVDEVHEIVKLRTAYEQQGVSFYLHLDAAYGGYARALFLDEDDRFLSFDGLRRALQEQDILPPESDWPTRDVYHAYQMMSEADSITIDPHKMGYVPYAAGGLVCKDKRVLDLIAYTAAYAFEEVGVNPLLLGSYIMEGSKAGAAVAAVWAAHRVVPLNLTGYGRLIGQSIHGARRFYHSLLAARDMVVAGRKFTVNTARTRRNPSMPRTSLPPRPN
jgi:glutamate/tyrosine decarboxylase-like PLP-dependent enzyme